MKLNTCQRQVSNLKCNFLVFDFELATRSETFIFQIRVSNSKEKK